MLDINIIRTNPEEVSKALAKREMKIDFKDFLNQDSRRRGIQTELEKLRAEKNKASKSRDGIEQSKQLSAEIKQLETELKTLDDYTQSFMAALPNIPLEDVVAGGKENNKAIRTFGKQRHFDFKPQAHVELCTKLGLIDYERGARMSGAGTWVYTGWGARLEWALLNYFIDFHVANGYTFIMPPHLLNYESGFSAGQFPKFIDDVFVTSAGSPPTLDKADPSFRFLLPTAETALINMHRGEIIAPEKLPIKYAAYSPCYRKEAGSYRTSERGMIRGYQFNKIEMFIYCNADQSKTFFEELVKNAEKLVDGLGLHFQTVALAAGDVSASMAKTYDIEVWIPSMNGYKEVSSASNAMDYQARRANIKTKTDGKNVFVHTLNASGLATSRIIPAIVEQFQTADGHIAVPTVLQKYLGGTKLI